MAKIYYEQDIQAKALKQKTIGVIGYGSQGHAHALNLKDSGFKVLVGLYEGSKSAAKAKEDGLTVKDVSSVTEEGDLIMILLPDEKHKEVYEQQIKPKLTEGKTLAVAHGFSLHFGQIKPPENIDVIMIAPKSPGHRVRHVYTQGQGVPALIAIYQDHSGQARDIALAYADGIGSSRAGVLETTFREETETDLFGEQAVLCGGLSALIKTGFETLVEAGYQPEMAYFECLHEVKLIVDLIYEGGLAKMRHSISNTAEYGDYSRGHRVINEESREAMREILQEIREGEFAREYVLENQASQPCLNAHRRIDGESLIEKVGQDLRSKMRFL